MVGMLSAPPGTKLYARLAREGRLAGPSTGNNSDGTTNVVPRMGIEKLRAGYARILQHIYAPGPYYKRVRTFLREYHPPKIRSTMSWRNLSAFLRSTFRLGIIGRERFQYWGLFGVDVFPVPAAAAVGRHAGHLRPPLPPHLRLGLCGALSASLRVGPQRFPGLL